MSAKSASPITAKKNAAQNNREFDPIDLERVQRGFIAKRESGLINDAEGRFVFDSDAFEFLRDGRPCPDPACSGQPLLGDRRFRSESLMVDPKRVSVIQ